MRSIDDQTVQTIQYVKRAGMARFPVENTAGALLEKDALVAEAIPHICAVGRERGARIVFCGGTSLSQAWGAIERMSEDADFRVILPDEAQSQGQRRKYLSKIKHTIVQKMESLGFPLDGEMRGRNGNAYMMGMFNYASRFPSSDALRSQLKIEITAFEPATEIVRRPLRTILDRITNAPEDQNRVVEVVGLADTLADKVVSYLRRTAADRAGCGRGDYDDRLVRHLYDTHRILAVISPDTRLQAAGLFPGIVERDRETYGNQFPAFAENPGAVLRDEAARVCDSDVRERYDTFVRSTVFGEEPGFTAVSESFSNLCGDWIEALPAIGPRERETMPCVGGLRP